MDFDTLTFSEVDDYPPDTVPVVAEVEHACEKCGRETGWSGRGRRKRFCDACKTPRRTAGQAPRVNGNASNIAAQAAKSLVGINSLIGYGALALGLPGTAKAILSAQEDFETQAYQALLTDPKFAAQLLNAGQVSAKAMLGMTYLTMGVGVVPVAMAELKAKKEAREQVEVEG